MKEEITLYFSNNLQLYIDSNKLSLIEFCELIDEPISSVHGWLNGVIPKNIVKLKKIAKLMGKSVDELCFNDIQKTACIETDMSLQFGNQKFRICFVPSDNKLTES